MLKSSRCKAVVTLLCGVGCLVGCTIPLSSQKPTLPEGCRWLSLPYSWYCFPDGGLLPVEQEERAEEVLPPLEEGPVRDMNPDAGF